MWCSVLGAFALVFVVVAFIVGFFVGRKNGGATVEFLRKANYDLNEKIKEFKKIIK